MTRKSWVVLLAVLLVLAGQGLVSSAGAADPAPVNQTLPVVNGASLRVGATLTADPGTWAPTPTSYTYAWLRDGSPISGATSSTYVPVAADREHYVTVRVVAVNGTTPSEQPATSVQGEQIGYGQLVSLTHPTISGPRRWGQTLTASRGTWNPAPTTVKYQWLRDGSAIRGATRARYEATVSDYGTHLSVRVAGRRDGYANKVVTSSPTGLIGHRVGVRKHFTYSIATRGPITADLTKFARLAAESYADPRGWRAAGYEFTQVAHGGDFTLVLSNAASVPTFGSPCDSTWSCRVGRYVIINQTRWLHASPAWNAAHQPLRDYRHMVINHETGHWLGHHHLTCPGKGRLAPVMMQQSKGLNGCRFNPFPLPSERWTNR